MLDNISETKRNSQQKHSQTQQQSSNNQVTLDFDSILQELKSVGEAHQPEKQTTMIVENITANIKQDSQINTNANNTGKRIIEIGRKTICRYSRRPRDQVMRLIQDQPVRTRVFPSQSDQHIQKTGKEFRPVMQWYRQGADNKILLWVFQQLTNFLHRWQ